VENHADASAVETGSDRQRGRIVVGRNGNDWLGDADRVRKRREFDAGEGGGAAAGVGRSRSTRCGLDANRAGPSRGKRDPGADGWGNRYFS
jgi:hypothetical protein